MKELVKHRDTRCSETDGLAMWWHIYLALYLKVMDRIIKLANEYNIIKENWFIVDDGWLELLEYDEEKEPMLTYRNSWTDATWDDAVAILISKSYGFIDWLCREDKVDYMKIRKSFGYMEYHFTDEELLLMQLAVKRDPLRFLSSLLRQDG